MTDIITTPTTRNRTGYGPYKLVCVVTKDGKHIRVRKDEALAIVADGGKFIPKHEYQGKIHDPSSKDLVAVDWSWKKNGKKPVETISEKPRKAPRKAPRKTKA